MSSFVDTRYSGGVHLSAPRRWIVLFCLSLLLIAIEPGQVPLFEPDEGRYSEIPREMLARGEFLTPKLNGVLYFEKPPLHYWLVAGSFAVFGQNEYAARIPSRLSIIGMAMAAFFFARKRYGQRVGLLSGIIVSTSILAVSLARITFIDPLLSFILCLAGFAFASFAEAEVVGDRRRAQRALYGLHVACAAAVLSKGLIGIVLPGAAIVIWMLVTGRHKILPRLFSWGPLLVFLALAVPWHVLLARSEPDFLNFYFVNEHFNRFFKSEHRRGGPALYFVAVLLAGFLPWTAFFGRLSESWPGRRLSSWRQRGTESFLWIFCFFILFFFSISKSKLIPYILPIWPAFAVLLALGMERARRYGAPFRVDRWILGMLYACLAAGSIVYGFAAGTVEKFGILGPALLMITALGAGALWNLLGSLRGSRLREVVLGAAVPWVVFLSGAVWALPSVSRAISPWPIASRLVSELQPGDILVQYGHYVQAVPFYTKRITPVFELAWHELNYGQGKTSDKSLFPKAEEFIPLWTGPRRVFAVFHKDHLSVFAKPALAGTPPVFLARSENAKHYLVCNRPLEAAKK